MPDNDAIICVDDEMIILMSLKQELREFLGNKFRIETCMNPNEVIPVADDLVAEGMKVRLLIADWLMPGMKGDELTLRFRERFPEARYILLTGQVSQESLDRILVENDRLVVLPKPWSTTDLYDAVQKALA